MTITPTAGSARPAASSAAALTADPDAPKNERDDQLCLVCQHDISLMLHLLQLNSQQTGTWESGMQQIV